jgi:ribosomal protein L16 Arg81 hydroxylase
MRKDMTEFRLKTGYTDFATFTRKAFSGRVVASKNLIVCGPAHGKPFRTKSHVHQDDYDNIMSVVTGKKIWALATLSKADELMAKKGKNIMGQERSFRLDAIDRTQNDTDEEHAIANKFDTVCLKAGDLIFVPRKVWHQVNSNPMTLAFTHMYK